MRKIILIIFLFLLVIFSVDVYASDPMEEFNVVLSNYYKNPQPEVVPKHFEIIGVRPRQVKKDVVPGTQK